MRLALAVLLLAGTAAGQVLSTPAKLPSIGTSESTLHLANDRSGSVDMLQSTSNGAYLIRVFDPKGTLLLQVDMHGKVTYSKGDLDQASRNFWYMFALAMQPYLVQHEEQR